MALNNSDAAAAAEKRDIGLAGENNGFANEKDLEGGGDVGGRSKYGTRIDKPRTKSIAGVTKGATSDDNSDVSISVGKQMEMEAGNAIRYRTCSWQKTAALLFSEYICLAIMSFPYSYAVLGLAPGLIMTVVIAGIVLYTSLVVW